ncbi:Gfo/Idh/MocA family oxidoreductase [Oscillospiraceae bacterium PP1C4]
MKHINTMKTAVIGCGAISDIYFQNLTSMFSILNVVACCDLNAALQQQTAEKYNLKQMSMAEIMEDKTIEMVINLTPPGVHYSVIKSLLESGKHVYTEKVLAVELWQAKELMELADSKNLYLGAAPDTFLGAAVQTSRFVVESGMIGEVTSCYAALNRDCGLLAERFPYTAKTGGGIGMDVGIYYVTALLSILGPVTEAVGICKTMDAQRTHYFTSKENFGEAYTLESENLMTGTISFASGVVGTIHFNSNSIMNERPQMVIYGTQGILYMPDPNRFGGDVKVLLKGQTEPFVMPANYAYSENCRGLGAAEMAWSIRKDRAPRACKEMAYHALEVLSGIVESSQTKAFYQMKSTFTKMPPLPQGYLDERYYKSEAEAGLVY